jgi:hypothetical protein
MRTRDNGEVSSNGGSASRFAAIIFTGVILTCGLGSGAVLLYTSAFVTPATNMQNEARKAVERLVGDLARDWSPEALRRVAQDPPGAALEAFVAQARPSRLSGGVRVFGRRYVPGADGLKGVDATASGFFGGELRSLNVSLARQGRGPWRLASLSWEPRALPSSDSARSRE